MATAKDWIKERRQKKESERVANTMSSDNLLSVLGSLHERKNKDTYGYTSLSKRFDNLYKKALDYYNNEAYKGFYDTYSGTRKKDSSYAANTGRWYSDLKKQSEKANEGIDELLAELDQYSRYYNEDAVKYVRDLITQRQGSYSDILKDAKEYDKYWSQYATEDDYNNALLMSNAAEAYNSGNYDAAEQALKERAEKLVSEYGDDHFGLVNSEEYKELLEAEDALIQKKEYDEYEPFWNAIETDDLDAAENFINAKTDIPEDEKANYQSIIDYNRDNADYLDLVKNEDFAVNSAYKTTKNGEEKFNYFAMLTNGGKPTYSSTGYGDLIYDVINGNEDAYNLLYNKTAGQQGAEAIAFGAVPLNHLTQLEDDEKKIFNYIYATEGKDAAYEYITHLEDKYLYSRMRDDLEKRMAESAKVDPIGTSIASVVFSPLKGMSYAMQAGDYFTDGELTKDAAYNSMLYGSNAARSTVSADIEEKWGKAGSFAYGVGMSMGDFLMATAVSGGNSTYAGLIMGMGAAADTTLQGIDRGLDSERAFITGTLAGAAEFFTEKMGVDNLLDKALLDKSAFKYVMKNMLSEGIEEGATDLINWNIDGLYDLISGQDKSEWKAAVAKYMDQGYSESEAFGKALGDRAIQLGTDVAAGAVSGGIMGGAGAGMQTISEYREGKTYKSDPAALIEEALRIDPNNELALSLQKKLADGKKISPVELGRLSRIDSENVAEALKKGDEGIKARETSAREGAKKGIENKIAGKIERNATNEKTISSLAETITKAALGEEVSNAELRRLSKNAAGIAALNNELGLQKMGEKLKVGDSVSAIREAISSKQSSKTKLSTNNILATVAALADMDESAERGLYTSYAADVRNGREVTPEAYAAAYANAMNDGKRGVDLADVKAKYAGTLSESSVTMAYRSGENAIKILSEDLQNGTDSDTINTNAQEVQNEQGIHLRDGGERYDGQNTQGQIPGMEGNARPNQSRREGRTGPRDAEAVNLSYDRELSAKDFGISGGLESGKVKIVAEGSETALMKEAKKYADENGLNAIFFGGGNLKIQIGDKSVNARAVIQGKNVYVRVDHADFTADQLIRHEGGHDMIDKGEIDIKDVRKRLKEKFTPEEINAVARAYLEAYKDTGLNADEVWEEIICDSLGDMNIFEGTDKKEAAEMAADFLPDLKETALEGRKEARAPPKAQEGKASRETQSKRKPTYIPYSKVGTEHINHINNELAKLYRGVTDGIADGIAIANGNKVFVVDSGKENGRISFGVRRMRTVSDVRIRQEYIRSQNNDAISKGYVSDELSSRIGDRWISDSRRDLRRESGAELSADQGKSADQQSRVSEENADNGGLKGKASIDLSSMDSEYMSAVERGDMETAQRMVDEVARETGYDSDLLYHGTTGFGFTKIDTAMSDDGLSFFATDSLETAGTYSGQDVVKNIGSKTDSTVDIDDLDAEYHDKARNLISQINAVAGYYNFVDYRSNRFGEFVSSLLDGTDSYGNVSSDLNDYIEELVSALYDNASYYDSDLMPEAFFESEDVTAIYDASSELYDILKKIADYDDGLTGNYQFYAKTEGLFEIDAKGNRWSKIPLGEYDASAQEDTVNTRQLARYAKDKGYTGVKIKNVFDDGGKNIKHQTKPATVYIFFNPQAQVKSADPVTYDDDGKVIPLSERFKSENDDIRYSFDLEMLENTTTEEQELSDRERLAAMLESDDMSPSQKGLLTKYKNKLSEIEANEAEITRLAEELDALKNQGKGNTSRAVVLEGKIQKLEKQNAVSEGIILNLEATKPIKRLLERERKAAYQEGLLAGQMAQGKDDAPKLRRAEAKLEAQKQSAKDKLADQRQKSRDKLSEQKQTANEKISTLQKEKREAYKEGVLAGQMAQGRRDAEIIRHANERIEANARAYLESRAKSAERREKTALKKDIRKLAKDINTLLKKSDKKKNVKQEQQTAVATTLALAEILFNDDIRNEDIVRLGVDSVTNEESKLLNKYRDLLDKRDATIAKIDSIYGNGIVKEDLIEQVEAIEKELAKINNSISYLNEKLSKVFEREKARLNKSTVDAVFDALITEYSKLANSDKEYVKNAYSEVVKTRLEALKQDLSGTIAKDMSTSQLTELRDIFKAIKHMISKSNNIFREGREEDLGKYVSNTQKEIFESTTEPKDRGVVINALLSTFNEFSWNNLRPVDAFERLGSKTFEKLFWDYIDGMGVAARDVAEARNVISNAREKYGYSKWNMKLADTTYTTRDGLTFKPTLGDKLSIYAYSKREKADGTKQAMGHMVEGGFTYDTGETYKDVEKGKTYARKKLSSPYRLSERNIKGIIASLTQEQRDYVDAILPYLTDMGKKGNEVSMTLYGIELFGDKIYFPLQSSADYLSSTTQELGATQTMSSLANSGFTKQTNPNADNPIVLRAFDDVVLEHIEKMSNYHGLVVPIENLRRVFDNVDRDAERNSLSTKALIGSRFGDEAQKYFSQMLTDFNGGISPSGAKNMFAKLFSKGKAMAVSANLSVVAQQYFSIIRAMEVVNPKYFVPFLNSEAKKTDIKQYEELMKYAPIAIIKEMNGFDVGSSGRVKDYIGYDNARKDAKYVRKKVDDFSMWGASAMDKLGWITIWKAIKAEVASEQKLNPGTKTFYAACKKRFTEVVTRTQVYDSVASRSGYMRSKSDAVKYATSFMGEPTVIMGRYFVNGLNLIRAFKSKNVGKIKKASGHFVRAAAIMTVSQVLSNLAKSLVYAGRDDEEDEAFLEKWAKNFAQALTSDLNPFNSLPFTRDIMSIIEGWDVERPDLTLIADAVTSAKKFHDGITLDEALGFIGAVGNLFGIPFKNIVREIKSVGNAVDDIVIDDVAPTDMGGAFAEGFTGEERTKKETLYNAIVSGDEGRVQAIRGTYKSDDAYKAAVKAALRENDPRIKKAARAHSNGNIRGFNDYINTIVAEGFFDRNTVASAIRAEQSAFNTKISEAADAKNKGNDKEYKKIVKSLLDSYEGIYSKEEIVDLITKAQKKLLETQDDSDTEDTTSIWKSSDITDALDAGDTDMALDIIAELIESKLKKKLDEARETAEEKGKDFDEDEEREKIEYEVMSSLRSSLTKHYKPLYYAAYLSGDNKEMNRIRDILITSELYEYKTDRDVDDVLEEWIESYEEK